MRVLFLVGLLIALPALVVGLLFFGQMEMLPALLAAATAILPFLVFYLLRRRRKSGTRNR